MPSFFGSTGDDGARKMKKRYDEAIKELLFQVGFLDKNRLGRIEFPDDEEPFDALKLWSSRISGSKRQLQELLSDKNSKIERLEQDLAITRSNLNKARDDRDGLQRRFENDMSRTKDEYQQKMSKEKEDHEKEQNRMKGQLLVNQQDNDGWADDKLKHRHQELHRLITNLANSREFVIPSKKKLDVAWDTSKFISRRGKGNVNFLLHSAIWTVIHEQFFSEPFGFGAFGPGDSQTQIYNLYLSWLKLVTKENMKPFSRYALASRSAR
jgi:hypothetical protein